MTHEHDRCEQGKVGEAEGAAEEVDVEEGKIEEEYPREKLHTHQAPHADHAEDLTHPHHPQHVHGQHLVAEELEQEEQDPHHDRNEN